MMRYCIFVGLAGLAAGLQARVAADEDTAIAVPAADDVELPAPSAPAAAPGAAPAAGIQEAAGGFFNRIGDFLKQGTNRTKKDQAVRNLAQEKKQKREELAPGRLSALSASLPQARQAATELCSKDAANVCEVRMKMFDAIAGKIESGDTVVVEMLRKSEEVLHEFMQMDDNLRGAISSLTLHELQSRPPAGMKAIADINPKDGNVDRYEWSEYMKAAYLFTLSDATASALEMKHGKSGNRMKKFISWDTRDAPAPKPAMPPAPAADGAAKTAEAASPWEVPPAEEAAEPPQAPTPEEVPMIEETATPPSVPPSEEAASLPEESTAPAAEATN